MESGRSNSSLQVRDSTVSALIPLLLGLLFLWWRLFANLHMEWTVNAQYNYGWAVPFLSAYLLWRRLHEGSGVRDGPGQGRQFDLKRWLVVIFAGLAFLYFPTRLIEEANPDWRIVSLALAVEVVGLTLLAVWMVGGSRLLARAAFPICFILVAVPWPTVVETPVIQGLSRANVAVGVELLGFFNVAAIQHGNVIEVATGFVNVDDACSGIRSLQAGLMISLFLGELYGLNFTRRLLCVLAGFGLSFIFNVARTSLLVWVASSKGIGAIAAWHDPAGVTILVGCFCGVWAVGLWLKRTAVRNGAVGNTMPDPSLLIVLRPMGVNWKRIGIGLCAWLVVTETGVEAWYRAHESRLKPTVPWTVAFPTNNPTFKILPYQEAAWRILRYNEGRSATWTQDGVQWQVYFLRWDKGRTAPLLARNHTPEVCLGAEGADVITEPEITWIEVHGVRMPFQRYEVAMGNVHLHVFYCLWNDLADTQGFKTEHLTYGNRLEPVLAGLRNPGQRSIEIAIWDPKSGTDIEALLRQALQSLIVTS